MAEIVVKMNIETRIKLSNKLKNSTSEIRYFSYTIPLDTIKTLFIIKQATNIFDFLY
jgi:hypothetical protein